MSSKIEVNVTDSGVQFGGAWFSHEHITGYTAEQLNSGDCHVTGREYMKWLSSAAPVVERQPVYQFAGHTQQPCWIDVDKESFDEYTRRGEWLTRKLYTAPPELAELQATIARLTAENERLARESERVNKSWHGMKRDLDSAKDEIERLKGGQGEAVAWKCTGDIGTPHVTDSEDCANAWYSHGGTFERLYTSQPAPISVVLPGLKTASDFWGRFGKNAYSAEIAAEYWNACLDKVKELNQ